MITFPSQYFMYNHAHKCDTSEYIFKVIIEDLTIWMMLLEVAEPNSGT